jgi:hypothetical protein
MARPKKEALPERSSIANDLIGRLNAVGAGSKAYVQGDHEKVTCGIKIPSIAFQWLIGGSTILPVQRMFGFSGLPKSFKSTLTVEVGNWFIKQGGMHVLIDNESKTSPDMLLAMTWRDPQLAETQNRIFKETSSIDQWQQLLTEVTRYAKETAKRPKGERVPLWVSIDSLTGKSTQDSQDKIQEEGMAATRDFPAEALKISRYFDSFGMLGTCMNLGYVQQMKQDIGAQPGYGGPKYREKGAMSAAFSTSGHIRVSKAMPVSVAGHDHAPQQPTGDKLSPPVEGYVLKLDAHRSCVGPDGRELEVDLLWQYVEQEDGTTRQAMWLDWYGALGRLLFKMKYDEKMKLFAYEKQKLKEAIDFSGKATQKTSAINCDELGLQDASFAVFGKAIEDHPEVSKRVQNYLHIKQYTNLQDADLELGDLNKDE